MTGADSGKRDVSCTLHDRGVMCECSSLPLSLHCLMCHWTPSGLLSCHVTTKQCNQYHSSGCQLFFDQRESYSVSLTAGGPLQINTRIFWNMSVYGGRVLWVSLNDTRKRYIAMITVGNDSIGVLFNNSLVRDFNWRRNQLNLKSIVYIFYLSWWWGPFRQFHGELPWSVVYLSSVGDHSMRKLWTSKGSAKYICSSSSDLWRNYCVHMYKRTAFKFSHWL